MCSLRVLLGPEPFLETDATALPVLRSLCKALNLPIQLDEGSQTVYLRSPLAERGLAILTTSDGSPELQAANDQIALFLSRRLACAGARAPVVRNAADLQGNSLILRLDLGNLPSRGVVVTHGWRYWRDGHRLAALITQEVQEQSGLPDLGTRVSVGSEKWAGLPIITVMLGLPDANLINIAKETPFFESVATGIYNGIARHWLEPIVQQVQEALQPFGIRPMVAIPPAPQAPPERVAGSVTESVSEEGADTFTEVEPKVPVPESEWVARPASIPILAPSDAPPPPDLQPVPNLTPVTELDLRPAPISDPQPVLIVTQAPVTEDLTSEDPAATYQEADAGQSAAPDSIPPQPFRRPVRRRVLSPCQIPDSGGPVHVFRRPSAAETPLDPVQDVPEPVCADENAAVVSTPTAPQNTASAGSQPRKQASPSRPQARVIQSSDSVIRFP